MKIRNLIILVVTILIFTACKKETSIDNNNEVMIFLTTGLGASSEPWIFPADLPYFDISNYSNIKSVVLAVNDIKTTDDFGVDVVGEGSFELYDITNGKTIDNSVVTSEDIVNNTYKSSVNFIDNIPRGKIKLGIRLYSGGAFRVQCRSIYLILSR